jgi:hypothetical protein
MFVFESTELALKHVKIIGNILQIIDSKEFFDDLKEIGSFWNCDSSGEEIHGILSDSWMYPATVVSMGWKRFKPWYRNTTAETSGRVIELNPKFMNRSEKDVANTLVEKKRLRICICQRFCHR